MLVDKVSDYRTQFSKWWVSEYKNVQFPEKVSLLHACWTMHDASHHGGGLNSICLISAGILLH